jgi:hypothetical protein
MKITTEMTIHDFEFWSSAKSNAAMLSYEQLAEVESTLDELYPDGMSDTELNDIFWHDFDTILEWLGTDYESFNFEGV